MRYTSLLTLQICLLPLITQPAMAAPLSVTTSASAGYPRADAGNGLCATAVHLNAPGMLISTDAARFFLTQMPGTNNVDDRLTTTYNVVNFQNGFTGANTDFPGALPLPFSTLPGALNPRDDQNIAMRLRGYVNIAKAGTYTFGVYADDGYSLTLAGSPLTASAFTDVALRDSRQVQFAAPGLYPIEIVYFQKAAGAVLELARSDGQDLEYKASMSKFPGSFALASSSSLYTAVNGSSDCTECDTDAACGDGLFCGAGLCQKCNEVKHCGPLCQVCAGGTPICDGNNCVACTADAQCQPGQICDTLYGECIARPQLDVAGGSGCSMGAAQNGATSTGGALALLAGLLGVFFFVVRRMAMARPERRAQALLLAALSTALTARAHAQSMTAAAPAETLHFNTQTFHPDLSPGSIFTVQGTLMPRVLRPYGGLFLEYANLPLRLVLSGTTDTYANTVPQAFTAHFMPGLGITPWLAAAVDLPVVLYQGFDTRTPIAEVPLQPSVAGVGDLRVQVKLRFVNNEAGGFGLGATPEISFPTGSTNSFRGEGTIGVQPRLVADYRFPGGSFVAVNVGYFARTSNRNVDYGLVRVSDELRYGAGLGIHIAKGVSALAELTGAASFTRLDGGPFYTPLEGYLGARYAHRTGVEVTLGGGAGMINAVGSPQFRLLASVAYVPHQKPQAPRATRVSEPPPPPPPPPSTIDTPAVKNDDPDKEKPKSSDVVQDQDRDGVPDRDDLCPSEAGPVALRGCPDSDKDGIPDKNDKCPTQPGPKANNGCPPDNADTDKDGIPDKADNCPTQPGPAENNGCPDPDADGDGVVDRLDKCPKAAGSKDNGGCPALELSEGTVKLPQPIVFAKDSESVEDSSKPALAALIKALRADSSLKKLSIEVSASGDRRAVKKLAAARAKWLLSLMTGAGINKKKLQIKPAKAAGEDQIVELQLERGASKGKKGKDEAEAKDDKPDDGGKKGRHHRRHKKSE